MMITRSYDPTSGPNIILWTISGENASAFGDLALFHHYARLHLTRHNFRLGIMVVSLSSQHQIDILQYLRVQRKRKKYHHLNVFTNSSFDLWRYP